MIHEIGELINNIVILVLLFSLRNLFILTFLHLRNNVYIHLRLSYGITLIHTYTVLQDASATNIIIHCYCE